MTAQTSITSFPFAVLRKRDGADVTSVSAKCESVAGELK